MRALEVSTLLGLALSSAIACSSGASDTSPRTGTEAAGSFAALAGAKGTLGASGAGGSSGAPLAQAGGAAGGEAPQISGGSGLDEAGAAGATVDDGAVAPAGWNLVWSDEFEGTQLDSSKWKYSVGPNNANNELEYYSDRSTNSGLDGQGHFLITARKESYMGHSYTSAKVTTSGTFQQKYGRFETRVQLPAGKGLWPAFWALGNNINSVGWPSCGEIDIMETVGTQLNINRGSLHGPGYSGDNPLTAQYHTPAGTDLSQGFHVYAAEWEENVVRFYVDGQLYETRTPQDLSGKRWVYDHPFYMIMNVAVGGTFPGNPDDSIFPRTMSIDYVRVYSR